MKNKKITIAIDGYSSCGKSTVAKALAKKLDYVYIDSGAMYRAVTLYCLQEKIIKDGKFSEKDVLGAMNKIELEFKMNPTAHVSEIYLNGKNAEKEIRGMNVSHYVSPVSAIKGVREKIVALQRAFGKEKGIVMDGRDIGTNVFPDAELKIFMTADENIRAQRRWKELQEKGMDGTLEDVKKNIAHRDYEDTHRQHNPLHKANDAVVLDNTAMTMEEQLAFALKLAKERINSSP
ncbi:MAG: (d)CMP kinase [Bacteroidetes bacterium]|nr:(d)CMP kinase [Bacteroidota bacterium]